MTKEELEKEAIKASDKKCVKGCSKYYRYGFQDGYITGAEPREKRIEELIALINAERERQEKCDDVHLRKIADLEKENAELKKENQKRKDGIALKDEEIGCIETDFNTFKSKAKELLERLLITSCNSDVLNLLPNCSEVLRVRVEAEQFLNSEDEK